MYLSEIYFTQQLIRLRSLLKKWRFHLTHFSWVNTSSDSRNKASRLKIESILSLAWSSKMKMLWEQETGSLIKTSLFASLCLKCHAEKQHFLSPAHRNLCAWQIEQEIKRIQSIQLSNTYMVRWFKLQSLKNLALSKLELCPGFFFLLNKFRKTFLKEVFSL